MPISSSERKKMMKVYLVGPKVVERLENVGITCLADLKNVTAYELGRSIDFSLGGKTIWATHSMAQRSLQNLIDEANKRE